MPLTSTITLPPAREVMQMKTVPQEESPTPFIIQENIYTVSS
jgi:hypothetical protein